MRKIIIDTDPGQDDALAILLALASDELDVLGITAVAGNVPLSLTTLNCRKICELASMPEMKIFAGDEAPLRRPLVTAEHVHGRTGLDGPDLPEPTMPLQDMHAVDFIIETLRAEPKGSVTLCTLGPLSNVARAFLKAPEIIPKVQQLIMMGGGFFEGGNITPTAEFNVYVDPEAANVVLKSGVDVVMMPLDVTHKALTTQARLDRFRAAATPPMLACADLIGFFERFDEEKYGTDGGPLHDPTVIAYLLKPELFSGRHVNVEVEIESPLTLGMTVMDWWRVTDRKPNAFVANDIDHEGFFDLLIERIARL